MPIVQKAINWDNGVWLKAVNAVADMNGWTAEVPNPAYIEGGEEPETIPNPVAKVPFFNAWLKKKAINEITEYNNRLALAAVVPEVDTEV
jgi:hypothetical protein